MDIGMTRSPDQLNNDDALDWFYVSFEERFGRKATWSISMVQRFLKWASQKDVSIGELIKKCPARLRVPPERYLASFLRKTDVQTGESFQSGLVAHSEKRLRRKGGAPLSLGAVLRMSMRHGETDGSQSP